MAEYEACVLGLKMFIRDSDLFINQVQVEWVVKNSKIIPYVQYVKKLCKRFRNIEFRHTPRIHNELANAFATIASMIKYPDTDYIDSLDVEVNNIESIVPMLKHNHTIFFGILI